MLKRSLQNYMNAWTGVFPLCLFIFILFSFSFIFFFSFFFFFFFFFFLFFSFSLFSLFLFLFISHLSLFLFYFSLASDHTSYPFATQNETDYFNLLSVYLDAVFYPKLDEIDFLQEGHRLEFENPNGMYAEIERGEKEE
jgi:hypothetical protein